MTISAWSLREIDPGRVACEDVFQRCRDLGWPVTWEPLPTHRTLLRFQQSGPLGEVTSLVAAASWAASLWPSWSGLAWDALDGTHARRLFEAGGKGPIEVPWLQGARTRWLSRINPEREPVPTELPCLQAAHGPVWIETLHAVDALFTAPSRLPLDLRLSVDCRLGQLTLTAAQAKRLRAGDVVLIRVPRFQALLQGHPLFSFDFGEGHMVINAIEAGAFDESFPRVQEAEPLSEAALDIAKLPVAVDVVLCRLTHTVAELSRLQPGSTFKLEDNVHQRVELRVEGQLLAEGELVQVGEGLGVQVHSRASYA